MKTSSIANNFRYDKNGVNATESFKKFETNGTKQIVDKDYPSTQTIFLLKFCGVEENKKLLSGLFTKPYK